MKFWTISTGFFLALAVAHLPGAQRLRAACDTAGWASCEELTGESWSDCGSIDCTREEIGTDPETGLPIFGDQECPKFAGQAPSGTTLLAGDVRIRILGEGGLEGEYSSWTTGDEVVCAQDYLCEGCDDPQGLEFVTPCIVTSTSNPQTFLDTVGTVPCNP